MAFNVSAGDAPNAPGDRGEWARPDKEGYLATRHQKLWATIAEGVLTETFFPYLDRAQSVKTELYFSQGSRVSTESKDFTHRVSRYPSSLAYHVSSSNSDQSIRIEKDIALVPDSESIIIDYHIDIKNMGLKAFLVHDPAADNTSGGDQSRAVNNDLFNFQIDRRGDEPDILKARSFQLLHVTNAMGSTVGFSGTSNDPRIQIQNLKGIRERFDQASYGNTVGSIEVPMDPGVHHFRVVLSFVLEKPGQEPLIKLQDLNSKLQGRVFGEILSKQSLEWDNYIAGLSPLARQSEIDILILKGLEDKTFKGAVIAAPSRPWLPTSIFAPEFDYESARLRKFDVNGGYTRVWPRDLSQIALAFLAVGDFGTATDIAKYLRTIQLSNGQFPQNSWVNGDQSWSAFQIDQTGFPIVIVSRLVEAGIVDYSEFRDMVIRAADVLVQRGPWTEQERWEENGGLSPNSIAVACQGLMEASWLEKTRDQNRSKKYSDTCMDWRTNLPKWTFVNDGPLGKNYFERLEIGTARVDPNYPSQIKISNSPVGGSIFLETEIIDGGFLQWILSGLVDPKDWRFTSTLEVYDRVARAPAYGSIGYLRYNHDAYGEGHMGKAWPLLSGERALVAMMRGEEFQDQAKILMNAKFGAEMSPEQAGLSATPLAWGHAMKIILNRSLQDQKSFYIPQRLERYQ